VDVLFVDLPSDFHRPAKGWCLGFRYMMSSLRENGFTAQLLHAPRRGGQGALIAEIIRVNARIVGLTTYDISLAAVLEFAADLRRAGLRSHITVGGMCASAIPEEILRCANSVDSTVFGEGEGAIVELAKQVVSGGRGAIPGVGTRVGGRVVRGETRPLAVDLDTLGAPALDGVTGDYVSNGCVPVVASRGCYGRCTFCCIQRYYRSCEGPVWRGRRPAKIVDEIVEVTKLSGARNVTFVDENFGSIAESMGRLGGSSRIRG
jgi:anaerobic magnesium-protoporphyrin IX monomethyl ester cyclase